MERETIDLIEIEKEGEKLKELQDKLLKDEADKKEFQEAIIRVKEEEEREKLLSKLTPRELYLLGIEWK